MTPAEILAALPEGTPAEALATIVALDAAHQLYSTRVALLAIAIAAGATPADLDRLADAVRATRGATIVLPEHRLEGLSRGSGWCRSGRGTTAVWGHRADGGGYRVGAGKWVVGGTDGFSRKGQTDWLVECIQVGESVYTIAN